MNNQFSFIPQMPQSASGFSQMFPKPQGAVYTINNPIEVGSVPIGSTGFSVALCLPDNLMYIKSFQNGAPVIIPYALSSYQQTGAAAEMKNEETQESTLLLQIKELEDKINDLQNQVKKMNGGKFNELL